MKIKSLIKLLEEYDPEMQVICSKDAEGNSYSPLSTISLEQYEEETSWFGYLMDEKDEDYSPNSIVMWPVN